MPDTKHIFQDLLARRVLLLDGATGTELTRRGVPTPLPLWSTDALRTHPDVVRAIHRDYAEAGADIIVANTFRSNVRALREAELLDQGGALNRRAVELARQGVKEGAAGASVHCRERTRDAIRTTSGQDHDNDRGAPDEDHVGESTGHRAEQPLVAVSIAPVEDCYHSERVPDERTLDEEHGQMLAWLSAAGPDVVWIETMNTVREARAAAKAAGRARLPMIVSFVVRENGDLLSGESLEDAVAAVEPFAPIALGLNCIPPDGVTRNLPRLRAATDRPLVAYAHIGNAEPTHGWSFRQDVSPQQYVEHAQRWIEIGARIVGGCCGTTPEYISALRKFLNTSHSATVV